MLVTLKDLYKGLLFRAGSDYYTIHDDEFTQIKGLHVYGGYNKKEMLEYFNNACWIIIKEPKIIYECW